MNIKKKEQQKKEQNKEIKNPIPKTIIKEEEKANPPVKEIVKKIEPPKEHTPELRIEDIQVEDIVIERSKPKPIPEPLPEPKNQPNTVLFNNLPKEIKLGTKYNMIYKQFLKKHYHFKHPTKGLPEFPNDAIKIIKNGIVIGFISNRRIQYQ